MQAILKLSLRVALLALLVAVVAAMVVPYSTIESALREFVCVKRVMNFADTVAPGWELTHLLSFGALGFLTHIAWRGARVWQVAVGAVALGTLVEVVQIWIPGRTAAPSHAILDVAGALLGFGVAWLCSYAWGSESVPRFQQSTHWVSGNSKD